MIREIPACAYSRADVLKAFSEFGVEKHSGITRDRLGAIRSLAFDFPRSQPPLNRQRPELGGCVRDGLSQDRHFHNHSGMVVGQVNKVQFSI
jgi:hypothetical protein